MTQGLNINRLVRVSVNLQPLAAARRGFGTLLVIGDSDIIGATERARLYTDLEGVAGDFGINAPEYKAAALYFGQTPRPPQIMIGRWANTATSAELVGGILTAAEKDITRWQAITSGGLTFTVNGGDEVVQNADFSGCTNLNAVADVINAQLNSSTIAYTGERFVVKSTATGDTVSIGWATGDLAPMLKLDQAQSLPPQQGANAETALEAVVALTDFSGLWYGCTFASATRPTDDELVEVAEFIEGADSMRIFGVTETDTRVLDATYTDDLASRMKARNFTRTCVQYSENPFAICSLFGRAFSVNFNANRSVITLMYKQEPGVVPAYISETQAQTLRAKRCNVFVQYWNDTAIIQYGVMSGNAYFDERHGLDWFADAVQASLYNLLYQSKTKIPQTDAGQNQLVNTCAAVCQEAVNNGLVAEGQWNADGFGQLERGDFLPEGFYIYSPPMATQDQSTREQRIAPPIQIALKLAGAIHEIDAIVDVNR